MVRLRRLLPAMPLVLMLGACTDMDAFDTTGAAQDAPALGAPVADESGAVSWESVVRSGSARVRPIDGELRSRLGGDQLLRLDDVDPSVAVFADRPQRLAGAIRLDELLGLWHGGAFGQDPPNAAVVLDDSVVSVELRGAMYDPATSAVVFVVARLETLDGTPAPLLPEGDLGPVTLFVDGTVVDSQITDPVTPTNVAVLGEAPAQAMGNLYQTIQASVGVAFQNTQGVYQSPDVMQTTTDQSVALLEAMDTTG